MNAKTILLPRLEKCEVKIQMAIPIYVTLLRRVHMNSNGDFSLCALNQLIVVGSGG